MNVEDIAKCVALYNLNPQERIAITEFKSHFVERWKVFNGASVLEIGCGQGDMTAVLADAVGTHGHVIATDPANPTYGSPITIGDSANYLSQSRLGSRITFHLNTDICTDKHFVPTKMVDFIVLAHCSYYFGDRKSLLNTFHRVKNFGEKICFSEWDTFPTNMRQISHLLAIFIQGQVESFKVKSSANVRSPFSKQDIERLLRDTGWIITDEFVVDSLSMKEYVEWEVEICLEHLLANTKHVKLPKRLYDTIRWQIDTLSKHKDVYPIEPLPSYSFVAQRR